MNQRYIFQTLLFVGAIILLNVFFQLHISIIGSLVLTVILNLVLTAARPRNS